MSGCPPGGHVRHSLAAVCPSAPGCMTQPPPRFSLTTPVPDAPVPAIHHFRVIPAPGGWFWQTPVCSPLSSPMPGTADGGCSPLTVLFRWGSCKRSRPAVRKSPVQYYLATSVEKRPQAYKTWAGRFRHHLSRASSVEKQSKNLK